ncbi:hypothetical protein JRC04_04450 [Mycolicibacterium sp. S2-37]|nr:hypothetical protein [Mycolicibacterium sp. S2-37]
MDADALAAEAEAEAEAAEAIAAATLARARATRLRERANTAAAEDEADPREADPDEADPVDEEPVAGKRRRFRRPRWAVALVTLALLGTLGFAAASGYVVWQHRDAVRQKQQSAEYAAAARQIVFTLMSIDAAKAQENVAQILDNSTGQFHDEFEGAAQDFVQLAEDGKVVTDVDVKAAAVESMTADSADVLVTASSTVTNAAGADKQPRSWRLSVTVVRDGDRLKMSKMEFVA